MNNNIYKISSVVLLSSAILLLDTCCNSNAADAAAMRPGFTANTLPRNDDGSTGLIPIGFEVDFYGVTRDQLYVNNNGNVTFDEPLPTYTPFPLTVTDRQIIAPFFADVDTRGAGSSEVTYGTGTVDGRPAFGVNWDSDGVGFYDSRDNRLNEFQLVMIDRSDINLGDFDFEFNYDQIQWETGQASGGDENGLGGDSARAGFASGTTRPGTFFELPGSAVNGAFLDGGPASTSLIVNSRNSDVLGRYVFEVRNGTVDPNPNPNPTVPEPTSILGSLALGVGFILRKAKGNK